MHLKGREVLRGGFYSSVGLLAPKYPVQLGKEPLRSRKYDCHQEEVLKRQPALLELLPADPAICRWLNMVKESLRAQGSCPARPAHPTPSEREQPGNFEAHPEVESVVSYCAFFSHMPPVGSLPPSAPRAGPPMCSFYSDCISISIRLNINMNISIHGRPRLVERLAIAPRALREAPARRKALSLVGLEDGCV